MKKRVLVLLIAALLVFPAAAFGSNLLGFRVGPTAVVSLNNAEGEDLFDIAWDDMSTYSFGADARFNFTLVELGLLAQVTLPDDDDIWSIDALPTVGVAFPLANVLRIGAGIGPRLAFSFGGDEENEPEIFDSNLSMRANFDIGLGGIILSAYGLLDSSTTFNDLTEGEAKFGDIFKEPNFGMGASVLFRIF